MTAEIGVLNKIGVALAADSAVTFDSKKIFNNADKLFSLSKHHPVGIMVYGNAYFMGIPWETIVKVYRKQLKDKFFNKLEDYCNDFFNFLSTDQRFINDKFEEMNVKDTFTNFLKRFLNQINLILEDHFQNTKITDNIVQQIIFGEDNKGFFKTPHTKDGTKKMLFDDYERTGIADKSDY